MRARQSERISSEEEERVRSGYHVTTHFNLAEGRTQGAVVRSADGETILEAQYAPGARLWRINHGWRRSDNRGFSIDPQTGQWERRNDGDEFDDDPTTTGPLTGVKPYVQDTRNLLLLQPHCADPSEDFQKTLLYALKRAMQFVYQVEEQEIEAELIGKGEYRRFLFWEAAEGGIGVWERLVNEPGAFADIRTACSSTLPFRRTIWPDRPRWEQSRALCSCLLRVPPDVLEPTGTPTYRSPPSPRLPQVARIIDCYARPGAGFGTTIRMAIRTHRPRLIAGEGLSPLPPQ